MKLITDEIEANSIKVEGESVKAVQQDTITIGASITTTGYAIERRFIFPGTDKVGVITKISIVGFRTSGTGTFNVRVVDASNANVICEATLLNVTDDSVITSLGTLSNLPTSETTLEVQGLNSNGGTTTFLSSLNWIK